MFVVRPIGQTIFGYDKVKWRMKHLWNYSFWFASNPPRTKQIYKKKTLLVYFYWSGVVTIWYRTWETNLIPWYHDVLQKQNNGKDILWEDYSKPLYMLIFKNITFNIYILLLYGHSRMLMLSFINYASHISTYMNHEINCQTKTIKYYPTVQLNSSVFLFSLIVELSIK